MSKHRARFGRCGWELAWSASGARQGYQELARMAQGMSDGCTIATHVFGRLTVGKSPRLAAELPIPWNYGAFDGLTDDANR
ncbi:hypothetical protein BHE74_00010198 [Ensete ventricosum]|nr:hypothetical protein BHE74_00010198 [Ensete ventricosum]